MVQPDHERDDADGERREDHRAVAEQRLSREGRHYFRIDAERGENEDVDLGMPPDPDEVHVEHRIAAAVVREEVEAEVAVEHQHRQSRRQHGSVFRPGDPKYSGGYLLLLLIERSSSL